MNRVILPRNLNKDNISIVVKSFRHYTGDYSRYIDIEYNNGLILTIYEDQYPEIYERLLSYCIPGVN